MQLNSLHVGFLTGEYIIPPHRLDGGLATYVQNAGRGLVERGHDVSVFCLSDRNARWVDQGVDIYEIEAKPLRMLSGPNRIWGQVLETQRTLENSRRLATKVFDVHQQRPLDVIQAASYQAVGLALCDNRILPLISRISSSSPLYRRADGKTGSPLAVLTDWCELHQLRCSDRCFAPSELMVRSYSRSRGPRPVLLRSPVHVQTESLDESFYESHLKGMKYLLYFGTLNRMKGLEVLSRTIGTLTQEFPDLHFVFIGRTGAPRDQQFFANKVLRNNPQWIDHIHRFPPLPKNLLFPAVRHAYGVVIPSLIDNYPNTCLEAMQFGRIVVGTKNSSIDEMIVDGETGILVEKGSAGSLQAGIARLLRLSPAAKTDIERRAEKAFEELVAEDRLGQLVQFYRTTIAEFNSGRDRPQVAGGEGFPQQRRKSQLWLGLAGEALNSTLQAFEDLRSSLLGKPSLA
jgi:glycosyltransferase involved in cell wall biosynthesis